MMVRLTSPFCTLSGLTGLDKQFKGRAPLWSPVDFNKMQTTLFGLEIDVFLVSDNTGIPIGHMLLRTARCIIPYHA